MTSNNKHPAVYLLLAALIVLLGVGIGYGVIQLQGQPAVERANEPVSSDGLAQEDKTDWENTLEYNGVTYRRNTSLKTILFMGVDDTQQVEAEGGVVGNMGRTDALMLFILDTEQQTARILEISRDTMVSVDVYDGNAEYVFSGEMQLNMQYAFGDGAARSCVLCREKVSELLYGIPINYYLSLTMEGISVIVDGLGGVTVTIPQDYTDIDPSYLEGAEITLDGAAAERFVRYRDTDSSGGNDLRMERQSWFLQELFRQMQRKEGGLQQLLSLQEAAEPYMQTDLDAETLQRLTGYTLSEETCKVPGETRLGNQHDEYYVDEDALRQLLIELFYKPVQ